MIMDWNQIILAFIEKLPQIIGTALGMYAAYRCPAPTPQTKDGP